MSKIQFMKSAADPGGYPESKKPEVAIAGRSNAGKSSLINAMFEQKIAKVSQAPGKTRLLNFFSVGHNYVLVDMPGYGFASRSGSEVQDWQRLVEEYLETRQQLCGLILVMDIRRDWTEDEELMKRFCDNQNLPIAVVLTKADKLSKSEMLQRIKKIRQRSFIDEVFAISNLKKQGTEDFETWFFDTWVKPNL